MACAGAHIDALADSMNDLLLPGKVIEGHAKYESDCSNCHKRFDKAAQAGLCKDCHKEISKDIAEKRGFHGRMKEQKQCRECHTEHKGRNARISQLDPRNFDHSITGFVLKGGHLKDKVQCKDCHLPSKKFRDAPTKCFGCHEKDDKHKGKFGTDCAACHEEKDWKTIHFDHSKSDFPLLGKHANVKCKSCHLDNRFKETPRDCYSCHKKDDEHKGNFGTKCATCHTERSWKEILFDHDTKTKFPLLGKHHDAKCTACHKGDLYKDKLQTDCYSCHKKDDKHKGGFGVKCEACHSERSWKEVKFDHSKTKFPLLGKHHDLKCSACHKGEMQKDKLVFKEKLKTDCLSCHEKDDLHKGQEGKKCENCHGSDSWKKAIFDHRFSRFPLTGKHLLVECKKCHSTVMFKDAKSDCWSCHQKQDIHKRAMGTACDNCHNTRSWKDWDFDHDKTRFKLTGKHKTLKCIECHNVPAGGYKLLVAASCVSCHDKDDKHNGAYGRQCDQCHIGSSWKVIKEGSDRWIKNGSKTKPAVRR
ncbi:MAG TPA: cytochrome C [Gallionellaceae bacterium]